MILRENWMQVQLHEETEAVIALPDDIKDRISDEIAVFVVMGVGQDVDTCRVGDHVVLLAAMGSMARAKLEGQTVLFTRESDVICVLNRENVPAQAGLLTKEQGASNE